MKRSSSVSDESLTGNRLLMRVAESTDRLEIVGTQVRVRDYIETPYNEFGIVDRKELFRCIMGSVAADFVWQGSYVGPHHLMWPRESYQGYGLGSRKTIPMQFRGCQTLKIILPRELHDYTHRITEPPQLPDLDTMEQYLSEQKQILQLYDTVRYHGLADLKGMPHHEKEAYRYERLQERLAQLEPGHVGLLPDPEYLAALSLHDARQALRSLARVQGLSNDATCKRAFFAAA